MASDIADLCLSLKAEGYEKQLPPQGKIANVFESKFDFLERSEPAAVALKKQILGTLAGFVAVVNDLRPEAAAGLPWAYHSWFHVTEKGGYFRAHTHPLASLSHFCVQEWQRIAPEIGIWFAIPKQRVDVS